MADAHPQEPEKSIAITVGIYVALTGIGREARTDLLKGIFVTMIGDVLIILNAYKVWEKSQRSYQRP